MHLQHWILSVARTEPRPLAGQLSLALSRWIRWLCGAGAAPAPMLAERSCTAASAEADVLYDLMHELFLCSKSTHGSGAPVRRQSVFVRMRYICTCHRACYLLIVACACSVQHVAEVSDRMLRFALHIVGLK